MIKLPPNNANDITIEITAPMIVIPLRQPSGKKHINYLFIE